MHDMDFVSVLLKKANNTKVRIDKTSRHKDTYEIFNFRRNKENLFFDSKIKAPETEIEATCIL